MNIIVNIYLKSRKKPFTVEYESKEQYERLLTLIKTPCCEIINVSNVFVFARSEFLYLERIK